MIRLSQEWRLQLLPLAVFFCRCDYLFESLVGLINCSHHRLRSVQYASSADTIFFRSMYNSLGTWHQGADFSEDLSFCYWEALLVTDVGTNVFGPIKSYPEFGGPAIAIAFRQMDPQAMTLHTAYQTQALGRGTYLALEKFETRVHLCWRG